MSCPSWRRHVAPLALALSLAIPAIAPGQGVPEPHVPLSTTLGNIAKVRAGYAAAFNAKNATAVTGMYTADASYIDADGSVAMGTQEIGARMASAAPNWPHAVVTSQMVKVYGATAIDVGTVTLHPQEGNDIVSRYLAVMRHDVDGWKYQSVALVQTR